MEKSLFEGNTCHPSIHHRKSLTGCPHPSTTSYYFPLSSKETWSPGSNCVSRAAFRNEVEWYVHKHILIQHVSHSPEQLFNCLSFLLVAAQPV